MQHAQVTIRAYTPFTPQEARYHVGIPPPSYFLQSGDKKAAQQNKSPYKDRTLLLLGEVQKAFSAHELCSYQEGFRPITAKINLGGICKLCF